MCVDKKSAERRSKVQENTMVLPTRELSDSAIPEEEQRCNDDASSNANNNGTYNFSPENNDEHQLGGARVLGRPPANPVVGSVSTSSRILNSILNAKNNLILQSYKLTEDELFTDLKSRFLEKHFRTILRSQSKPSDHQLHVNNNKSDNACCKDGASNPLNPLKIITVERPEPQLDLPRVSYVNSTRLKFLKMHDQVKSRVADRYRKLCASFRTTVLPQLYPVQVFMEVIFSNLLVMLAAPFVCVALLVMLVARVSVGAVLKLRYKGRYHLMSGSDAAWAHQSYANDSSFLSLYVIQGDCSISRIRDRIMKSVINCQDPQYPGKLTYSRLKCRITEKFGFYCWETLHPMDFCIDDHVRYITNDPSAVLTQEQVLREIQKFIDQPLPPDQPQWQILVVPKFLYSKEHEDVTCPDILEDDGFGNFDTITIKNKPAKNSYFYGGNHYYALIWRINHALMDGISAANCLQHCIADMPVKLTVDPLETVSFPGPVRMFMYLRMLVFGSRSFLRSMMYRDLNCFHGPTLSGPKTLGWSRKINMGAVKRIKKRNQEFGTTTTSLFASCVGSSLRGLAIRKNNPVPSEIRAGVTCAIMPYSSIRPQNRFTVAHLKLKLELESAVERLQFANKSTRELGRSADVLKNFELIRLVGLCPKRLIPLLMDNCEATVLISNVPGPVEEYTIFQGQKLVDIVGWNTIKGNTAIGVCMFSYAGRIRAGVIADGAVMSSGSDVPSLIEEFEKDLIQLGKDADIKEKDVFREAF